MRQSKMAAKRRRRKLKNSQPLSLSKPWRAATWHFDKRSANGGGNQVLPRAPFGLSLSKPWRDATWHFDMLSANGGKNRMPPHAPFGLSLSKPWCDATWHFDKLSTNGAVSHRGPSRPPETTQTGEVASGQFLTRSARLALLLCLGACASPPLLVEQPVWVDVPPGWSADAAAGARAPDAQDGSLALWWQRFDDPLLGRLVDEALRANPGVNGAQAALRQAQALRDVAAAGLWPSLGASASARRGSSGGHSTGSSFQAGLDAQWVPDAFGGLRSALDASDAALRASGASLGDTQVQVAAEVALDYILLRTAQARLAIAGDNLASQQQTLQITQWREQAGLVTALDTDQARASAEQTAAALPAVQTSISQARHALAVLTGEPPAALEALLAAATPVPQAPVGLALRIPAETLRQRADVRGAEYQVAAALARVGQAQAQRWPSFAIGGSLGLSALTLGTLTNSASVVSSLLASVSLPVFDGGAARAQVRAQQAALEQARQAYRAAVLGALREVEDALVALRGDRLRLASLRRAADAAANAALLASQRYGSGLVDFQAVLDTQRTRFGAQDSVAGAMADVSSDHVRLFTALGGGWRPSDDSSAPAAAAGTRTPTP